jgi:hypothetical protein
MNPLSQVAILFGLVLVAAAIGTLAGYLHILSGI